MQDVHSDASFLFVQRCQVALGRCYAADIATVVETLWDCLDTFPVPHARDVDRIPAMVSVYRIAVRFFATCNQCRALRAPHETVRRRRVNQTVGLIIDNYRDEDLTLSNIADRLAVSSSLLSRAIATETRHSFPTHVNGVRVFAAISHLGHGERVKSVAALAGYRSSGELDRQFGHRFGIAPTCFSHCVRPWRHETTAAMY
jgi:AraC-like DNA-binding protein